MKKVIMFHGYGGNGDNFWFTDTGMRLQKVDWHVERPDLPNPNEPLLKEWLKFVLTKYEYDQDTTLITHSLGGPLALKVLEKIETKIDKLIMVAGFAKDLPEMNKYLSTFIESGFEWEKIKFHCKEFVFINSDNDPWGCDDEQGRFMMDKLGGTQIIVKDAGHMGSEKFNQTYQKFPLVAKLAIDK